jgi:hypothetical protein
MKIFPTKVVEKIKTHVMFNNHCFENRTAYKIMWKKTVGSGRQHGARALHAEYLKAETRSKYIILTAFPLQQLLHKCASLLRYTCIVVRFMFGVMNVCNKTETSKLSS